MAVPGLYTCLSPALFAELSSVNKRVVVIDVLRATSTICSALYHGMNSVITVADTGEAASYIGVGHIVAAERQGKIAEGFQYGNSPLTYQDKKFKDKTLILTTTNGTKALEASKAADELLCGAFVNLDALSEYMYLNPMDSILLCAGWRNQISFEDSLFAGAIIKKLSHHYIAKDDASLLAVSLYEKYSHNLFDALKGSNHFKRLSSLGNLEDIRYCSSLNVAPLIPRWTGKQFVTAK